METKEERQENPLSPQALQATYEILCQIFGLTPEHLKKVSTRNWRVLEKIDGESWSYHLERELSDRFVVFTQYPQEERESRIAFLVDSSFSQVLGFGLQTKGVGPVMERFSYHP